MSSKLNSCVELEDGPGFDHESSCQRYGTRIQLGAYIADIVPDEEEHSSIHHCIVQRVGSANVIYLGQEDSFAAALETGYRHLEELAKPHHEQIGAIYEFEERASR